MTNPGHCSSMDRKVVLGLAPFRHSALWENKAWPMPCAGTHEKSFERILQQMYNLAQEQIWWSFFRQKGKSADVLINRWLLMLRWKVNACKSYCSRDRCLCAQTCTWLWGKPFLGEDAGCKGLSKSFKFKRLSGEIFTILQVVWKADSTAWLCGYDQNSWAEQQHSAQPFGSAHLGELLGVQVSQRRKNGASLAS